MGSATFPQMDRPPLPPSVTSQMGGGPGRVIGSRLHQQLEGQREASTGGGESEGPQGRMLMQAQAISAVLKEMARESEAFAPIALRIEQLLQQGLGEAISGMPNQPRDLVGSAAPSGMTGIPG